MPSWKQFEVSACQTHHTFDGEPVYTARFSSVLKFHSPGFAPVNDPTGSYHITEKGDAAYKKRFLQTFGFYEDKAAVQTSEGWFHINTDGNQLYSERFDWCGNFQEKHCCVKDFSGRFFHITVEGKVAYSSTYAYAGDFKDGFACVQDDAGFYTHIDTKGHFLHEKKYLDLDVYHKGYARAKDHLGWHHINLKGLPAYSFRFKMIEPFYNGIARVETWEGALQLIDTQGNIRQNLKNPIENTFHQVSADLVSYWKYYTLDAACTLRIFDYLPCTSSSLSQILSLPMRSTLLLLKALQEIGYLINFERDMWDLTTRGKLLTSRHPQSLLNAQKLWKAEHLDAWKYLLYSLNSEKPAFDYLYSMPWFDYLKLKPEKNALYHEVLTTYAKKDYQDFKNVIDFTKHGTVLDVGGSNGSLIFDLLSSWPHLDGILLDLPEVISQVKLPINLVERVQLLPGNFFDEWRTIHPDAIIFSRVLHDWSDFQCLTLLRKAHRALANSPNSRIYILENIHEAALLNLNMLVMTEGKERSMNEFTTLLSNAGWSFESSHPLNEVSHILVARKQDE